MRYYMVPTKIINDCYFPETDDYIEVRWIDKENNTCIIRTESELQYEELPDQNWKNTDIGNWNII